jgi:leucyl aminopeptidase
MEISFAPRRLPTHGAVVAGVLADRTLTPAAEELDRASGGAVRRAMDASRRFHGKPAETVDILAPTGVEVSRILLVGLGEAETMTARDCERLGGELLAKLNAVGEQTATVMLDDLEGAPLPAATQAARMALGARLRSYRFDKYRTRETDEDKPSMTEIAFHVDADSDARAAYAPLSGVADGVVLTRDLVSEPANELSPEALAKHCRELESLGVSVEVLNTDQLEKLGMGALLAVAGGSEREPRVVTMRWSGAGGDDTPLAVVGKGVCFDSGGISIKPAGGMEDMKWDMGGAGVTVGLMKALAARKAPVNVVGAVGLVENMPSGTAYRPGDIVTSMSGQTIEVINTDAEGRLVLADTLWYTQNTYKPETVIDLATLTGAIIVTLGNTTAGVFSNSDDLAKQLIDAGGEVDEPLWQLPVNDEYDKDINTDSADMKNTGEGRNASSIAAAQFLRRFIQDDISWAHLDIAGVTWSKKDKATVPKGGTGFGVRLLDHWIAERYERE